MEDSEYKNIEMRNKLEHVLETFKFSEPDPVEVGILIDPYYITLNDSTRKLSNTEYKWSFNIPSTWTASLLNDNTTTVQYSYDKYQMLSTLSVSKDIKYNNYVTFYEDFVLKNRKTNGTLTNSIKKSISEKGAKIKKYENSMKINGVNFTEYYYIISKNGYTYTLSMVIADVFKCDNNLKVFEGIWQSLKFD